MPTNKDSLYIDSADFQCLEQLQNNAVDIYLSTCGIQNCTSGHFFGPGMRKEYILHFICEGKGIYTVNGTTYELFKGDVFLICPETEVYYKADANTPWSYVWVGFQGIKASTYLRYAGLDKEKLTGHFENTTVILSYVHQMILARTLTWSNELKRDASLLQVLAALIDNNQSVVKKSHYDYPHLIYIEQAKDYIATYYDTDIRISNLADYIGINRSYLTQIFKKSLGLSPQEYVINYRIVQACALLENPDIKISVIASKVGYDNPLTFSRIFKRYKGISPSEYRYEHGSKLTN